MQPQPGYPRQPEPRLTDADGLALGRYDDDVLVDLNAVLVAQNARQHDLGPVADGVHLRYGTHVRRLNLKLQASQCVECPLVDEAVSATSHQSRVIDIWSSSHIVLTHLYSSSFGLKYLTVIKLKIYIMQSVLH